MSRARAQSGPTISLFPFLAVLLCTMGALLVVLVIFSRSAKQAGIAAAEQARAAARQEELELAREELGWRIDQVRFIRDRTAEELAKARMQLAGTEEQARQLADELDDVAGILEALEAAEASGDDADILDLERRLAEARAALDDAKEKSAERPPAYAVVPYEGANGTQRRPLYIECCIDGVFLQPEGIRLGPADFEGPPGPGNPLASALRAAREHIARTPGESGDPSVQPYPLLLVRPSGVMAYYAARESIQSWGSEFGYQFVDEDWTLTYPPRDAALADVEQRAVEEARRRLEWLAQVQPPKRTKPAVQYRAATTRGGVVSSSGPSVLGDQSRFDWTEEQAGIAAGGRAAPGRGFAADGGDSEEGLASGSGGDAILGNRYAGPSKFYAGGSEGGGQGGSEPGLPGVPAGGSGAGAARGGTAAADRVAGTATGVGSDAGGGGHDTSATRAGIEEGGPGGSATAAGASDAATAAAGVPGSASGTSGSHGGGSSAGAGSAGSAAGGAGGMASAAGGGGGGGPSMPGLAQGGGGAAASTGASGASASLTASMAGTRGSNWASLATASTPVPLTRPIRVECAADEFRILAQGGRVQSRIPIGTHTIDSIDPFVREVHATVGRWGLAGDRMYWKPELVLSATPDGVGRREDLERLLADSGLDTRRSELKDQVRNLPPVQRTGGLFPRK